MSKLGSLGPLSEQDLIWEFHRCRKDGDLIEKWVLVHGSGRILAGVILPEGGTDGECNVYFYMTSDVDRDAGDLRFIDAESARRFVMTSVIGMSTAPSKPKNTRARSKASA